MSQELEYVSELVPYEYREEDGTATVGHDEVFKGIFCKHCKKPVPPPKQGWQPRCLNPDCRSTGLLRAGGPGHKPKVFYFTYEDLAKASGLSKSMLRTLVFRKKFDPRDFASVAKLLRARGGSK